MEDKSFKFFKMLVADSEVHAKTIPRGTVVIVQMLVQTPFKITGETDVVEFVPPVKGVNTLAMTHILLEKILIFLNCIPAYSFNVLANERRLPRHSIDLVYTRRMISCLAGQEDATAETITKELQQVMSRR